MIEIGSRARTQPPPPHIVVRSLTDPEADGARPWLSLLADEHAPATITADPPRTVTWSSIWTRRPDAVIRFDVDSDGAGGTRLRWTVTVDDPPPDEALVGHLRHRMNELVNSSLRKSYGQ